MSIKIIRYDEKPITLIGECVGGCYGSDTTDDTKNYKRGLQCIKAGHGRVEEYPDVIMEINGYSIKAIRELYTHIIGVTRTQESTRYVNMSTRGYVVPPTVIKSEREADTLYDNTMNLLFLVYERLLKMGIPKEDASMVLPLALKTKITLKINVRALLNMAEVRLCSRAYWEYRQLMYDIKDTLSELSPEWEILSDMMEPKCVKHGYCTEHSSCGRMPHREER